jgi:hypothetical protein
MSMIVNESPLCLALPESQSLSEHFWQTYHLLADGWATFFPHHQPLLLSMQTLAVSLVAACLFLAINVFGDRTTNTTDL